MFFGALIFAPWAYGGTTATSIVVINWLIGASLLLWAVELAINRRKPNIPLTLVLICAVLCLIGAWMLFNAKAIYDPEFGTFVRMANFSQGAPGSLDYALSAAWMVRGALLLLSILFVVDLSQDDKALIQLWAAIVISGGSIALLGLLQKATGAHAILWQTPVGYSGGNFFATYYYHANAGAFLNLILPFTAGFAVRAFGTPSSSGVRALWLTIFLLSLAAVAANTSRMAQLIGALIIVALVIRFGARVVRGFSRSEKNVMLAGAAAVLFVMYAIGRSSHLEEPIHRWEKLSDQISADARWSVSRIALHTLPDAGLLGSGPGTFRAVFPAFNRAAEHPLPGQWRFLHEDYLQTVIEWGWIGSAFWGALFFGGIGVAVLSLRRQNALRRSQKSGVSGQKSLRGNQVGQWNWRRRVVLPSAFVALVGVALHALVDFPLQIESIQLYVAACLGLCWGSAVWKVESRK